jgi:hypothetical protein
MNTHQDKPTYAARIAATWQAMLEYMDALSKQDSDFAPLPGRFSSEDHWGIPSTYERTPR